MLLRDANPETLLSGFGGDAARDTSYSKDYAPSEESQVPILQHAKSSGMRNNYSDEVVGDVYDRVDYKAVHADRSF